MTASITVEDTGPNVVQAVEYNSGADTTGGDIEVAFSEPVGPITLDKGAGGNTKVFINGEDHTTDFQISADNGDDGRLLLTSSSDIEPVENVQIEFTDVTDNSSNALAGGNGNRTVKVTAENLAATGSKTVYQGAPVAYVVGQGNTTDIYKVGSDSETFHAERSSPENGEVFYFDSAGKTTDMTWVFDPQQDRGTATASADAQLNLRNLGLGIAADGQELTQNDAVTGTVSSLASDRDVRVTVLSDGEPVEDLDPQTITLGGNGEATYSFDSPGAGEYTVVATDVQTGNTVETDTITVTEVTGDVNVGSTVITEERGDVVTIELSMSGGVKDATVTLGDEDRVSYEYEIAVTDTDGDGTAVIDWNTAESHLSGGGISAGEEDGGTDVTPSPTKEVEEPIEVGEYPLSVGFENTETDLATIIVEERSTISVSTHTAPQGATTNDVESVEEAASSTDVGDTVAVAGTSGDKVILTVEATGFEGYIDEPGDLNSADHDVNLTVREQDGTTRINQQPVTLYANATDADGNSVVNLYPDADNDVYYVVFSSSELLDQDPAAEAGDKFDVTLTVNQNGNNDVTSGSESVSASFQLVEGSASFDLQGQQLLVPADANAQISGTSTWAPGTELTVRLRSSGGQSPFVKQNEEPIIVQADGTWSSTFDMSEQSEGQEFDATLSGPVPDTGDEATGVVGSLSATATFSDQTAQDAGTLVVVDSVFMSQGGFVAIHQGGPTGPVIGVSDYLEPGTTDQVRIRLDEAITGQTQLYAMPHRDTDENRQFGFLAQDGAEDGPYTSGGAPVTDDAVVTLEQDTTEPPPTTTEPPATTTEPPATTTEPPATTTEPPTETPTDTPTPGFGLAVALIALAAAALLAVRRD